MRAGALRAEWRANLPNPFDHLAFQRLIEWNIDHLASSTEQRHELVKGQGYVG
jgi:hypothetical protein